MKPTTSDLNTMKSPSSILRSFSLRWIQPSATVAPLPATTQFSRDLTAELNTTLHSLSISGEQNIMPQLLDAAITTQKIALNSVVDVSCLDDVERGALEEYLETNVDILDACNHFVERIEDVKKYVESLRNVAHATTSRALDQLELCDGIGKRFKKMGRRDSCLRRRQKLGHDSEFSEILCGSKAMALMCCMFLGRALSFDCSKGGKLSMMKQCEYPCSWLRLMRELAEGRGGEKKKGRFGSMVMIELQQIVSAARELKGVIKGKREKVIVESCVERVKRSCKELEGRIDFIERKVRDLYKGLIDVRMALLGILSQA